MSSLRVVIVDDQELVRSGIRLLLESDDDLEVVGEAADGRQALDVVARTRPDVVLMDLRMPVLDGIGAMTALRQDPELAEIAFVVLTTFDHDDLVFAALRAGAVGFLLKDTDPDALRQAVRHAAAGDSSLSPSVARRVIAGVTQAPPPPDGALERLSVLTEREREVLTLVGTGLRNVEIAERLVISPETVRTHVGRIMAKLQVGDRAGLVVVAYETGLVRPGN
jgi:DNA-binding NarL/FixJ family response regulator